MKELTNQLLFRGCKHFVLNTAVTNMGCNFAFEKLRGYGRLVETHKERVPCGKKVMELKGILSMRECREVAKI